MKTCPCSPPSLPTSPPVTRYRRLRSSGTVIVIVNVPVVHPPNVRCTNIAHPQPVDPSAPLGPDLVDRASLRTERPYVHVRMGGAGSARPRGCSPAGARGQQRRRAVAATTRVGLTAVR